MSGSRWIASKDSSFAIARGRDNLGIKGDGDDSDMVVNEVSFDNFAIIDADKFPFKAFMIVLAAIDFAFELLEDLLAEEEFDGFDLAI